MLLADPRSHCHSTFCCCVVVCILRLSLPLSDRVPVVVLAAAAVVFQLPLLLSDRVGVLVALGGKDVMVTNMDVVDASKGLLSETNKQTNKHALDCNCSNRCNGNKHNIDRYILIDRCCCC